MKTAVEWLIDQVEKDSDIIFYDRNLHPYQKYIEQAKEMEKEQIKKAFHKNSQKFFCELEAEQYYNETFKSE